MKFGGIKFMKKNVKTEKHNKTNWLPKWRGGRNV